MESQSRLSESYTYISKRFLATGGIESWDGIRVPVTISIRAITSTCPSVDFRYVNSPTLSLASREGEPVQGTNPVNGQCKLLS